jgi:LuxR family transcriptional regulator, maltose regulon positive regulatory protein
VLVLTKLHPPPLRPGHVARPRLVERLDRAAAARASLVRAPAGGGKTSLVAEWRAASGAERPFAWVSLDPADNDPVQFWAYVVEALRGAGLPVPPDVRGALAAPASRPTDAALPRLLNALAERPLEAVLVLDDVHVVTSPAVLGDLGFFVERLPPGMHVCLASRAEPPAPFPVARLRARGELHEIAAEDLRFDPGEADDLLNGRLGLGLAAADVERLQARTEGWAAGLYLAALSLRGAGGAGGPGSIAEVTGDSRHLADYLTAEVLDGLPPDVGDFLVRTSILPRMCGPLCDRVLGRARSAEVLERLERSNVLVTPLDTRRLWFRYHHLFAELLRHRLEQRAGADEVAELHRRAAAWWEEHGEAPEAFEHALAAGDHERAVALIARHWNAELQRGRIATVLRRLDALPAGVVAGHPELSLARAWVAVDSGDPEGAERHAEAAGAAPSGATSAGPPDARPALPVRAGIAMLRATVDYMRADLASATARAREALGLGVERSPWRAVAQATLGSSLLWLGAAAEEADAAFGAAIAAAQPGENMIAVLRSLGGRGLLRCEVGEHDRAVEVLDEARAVREAHGLADYPWAAMTAVLEGRVADHAGELDAAAAAYERARLLAARGRVTPEAAYASIRLAGVEAIRGRDDEARAAVRRARAALAGAGDAGMLVHELTAAERAAGGTIRAGEGDELTEREIAVLRMLAGSLTQREIASALYVSVNTLKTHTRTIYRKLGASSRVEAVALSRQRGLL